MIDGDSIEVMYIRHPERIRLSGIDCSEKGQAYGKRAKQSASALFFGKEVTLQTHGKNKYGRTIAHVLVMDGIDVNPTLAKMAGAGGIGNIREEVLEGLELSHITQAIAEPSAGLLSNCITCMRMHPQCGLTKVIWQGRCRIV